MCADKDVDQKETEIDKDILDDCSEYVKANKILQKNFENQLKGIKNRIKISFQMCIYVRNYFCRFIASLSLLIEIIYNF